MRDEVQPNADRREMKDSGADTALQCAYNDPDLDSYHRPAQSLRGEPHEACGYDFPFVQSPRLNVHMQPVATAPLPRAAYARSNDFKGLPTSMLVTRWRYHSLREAATQLCGVYRGGHATAGAAKVGPDPARRASATWEMDLLRVGEAKNPGPSTQCGAASERASQRELIGRTAVQDQRDRGAECDDLVQGYVAFQKAWTSWADCLEMGSGDEGHDDCSRIQGLANAARLAQSAMIELARRRARWQRSWGARAEAADTGDVDPQAPRTGRTKLKKAGADPLDINNDDPEDLADFKRGLRRVSELVRAVVRSRGRDEEALRAVSGQVQRLADMTASAPLGRDHGTRTGIGSHDMGCASTVPRRPNAPTAHSMNGQASATRTARTLRTARGRHEARRPQYLEVFYANVTSFSDKAEAYMIGSNLQVWFAAETHLRGGAVTEAARKLAGGGWHCFYSDAARSDRSATGTQGGVLAAARNHLCVQPMARDVREDHGHRSATEDLVGLNVPLRGAELLVFGGYAREGKYLPLLAQVAKATMNGKIPFVWLADFNVPPEALENEPALTALDAVVLRPTGGAISCHQGAGSLIDFAIASRRALPLLDLSLIPAVPWSPHEGLRLRIRKNTRDITVKKLVKPLPFDHRELQEERKEPWDLSWRRAKEDAASELGHINFLDDDILREQKNLVADVGGLDDSVNLGKQLLIWSRAVENQALAARGIDPQGHMARKAKGRAAPLRFVEAPIARRRCDPGPQRLPGGYTDAARIWATLRIFLVRLHRAHLAGDRRRVNRARIALIRTAAGANGTSWKAWQSVLSACDEAAARIAVYRACAPEANNTDVEAAIALVQRLEAEETARARREANVKWHAWVARALRGGARDAHSWANAPNTAPNGVHAPG